MSPQPLRHELLEACGVAHGFGVRGALEPAGLVRPRQVHGRVVARLEEAGIDRDEADAVVSRRPGRPVGVVTADCVPILAAGRDGAAVAAIHAGWRGLAAGVVRAGIEALREAGGGDPVAVLGPYIHGDAYEVDAPVLEALRARFGEAVARAAQPTRPGHARLDLGALVRLELTRAGLEPDAIGEVPGACTFSDARRFHSFRRDGEHAGRLVHHVAAVNPHTEA